jgi:tRNA:m4X modification enzyme
MFGLTAAGVASAANQKVRLTMVERGVSRSKADTVLRNLPKNPESSYLKLEDVQWSRLVCDLAHVNLPTVMKNQKGKILVIAKHLCGSGTDLALKSIDPIKEDVSACVLATCCHGVCTWKDYVGRDYLTEAMECDKLSFGSAEFDLLRRWSAGTVSSLEVKTTTNHNAQPHHQDPADVEVEHTVYDDCKDSDPSQGSLYISAVVQHLGLICGIQGLGRACQRLIDHGRREYLRRVIFAKKKGAHKLIYYVPPEVTPQNALLLSHEEY